MSGRLWAELEVTDDPGSRLGKPPALKVLFQEVHHLFQKSWRRSEPKGFWVGPTPRMAVKREGLKLRVAGHKGGADRGLEVKG